MTPIHFTLSDRLVGYTVTGAKPGEQALVRYRELISPTDALHLTEQLEQMQQTLFCKIPGAPIPSLIDHLLVIINQDLNCVAYVNELSMVYTVKTTRGVEAGAQVYVSDIADVASVDLGVDIPANAGVVFVRSLGWKRSLFFDLGPLIPEVGPRQYALKQVLAHQALQLLGIPGSDADSAAVDQSARLTHMTAGLSQLRQLLKDGVHEESAYQELLAAHPWMLGGLYSRLRRHAPLDDQNIPDFTAVRCYDGCDDIVELKQPFLSLFKTNGDFSAEFNDAWNQAERYLSFAQHQRSYLLEQKNLRFEVPRCLLLIGYNVTSRQLQQIRSKESFGRAIYVFTYDHLLEAAEHLLQLMRTAHERPSMGPGLFAPSAATPPPSS